MAIEPKFSRFSAKVVVYICVHICNIQGEQYFTFCGVLWDFIQEINVIADVAFHVF